MPTRFIGFVRIVCCADSVLLAVRDSEGTSVIKGSEATRGEVIFPNLILTVFRPRPNMKWHELLLPVRACGGASVRNRP